MVKRIAQTIAMILILAAVAAPAYAAYEHYAMRINCGGGTYDASFADHYIADQAYTVQNGAGHLNGIGHSPVSNPIAGTEDDLIYQSERYATNYGDINYQFDVHN